MVSRGGPSPEMTRYADPSRRTSHMWRSCEEPERSSQDDEVNHLSVIYYLFSQKKDPKLCRVLLLLLLYSCYLWHVQNIFPLHFLNHTGVQTRAESWPHCSSDDGTYKILKLRGSSLNDNNTTQKTTKILVLATVSRGLCPNLICDLLLH